VTRKRLYLQTMESVLGRTKKVLLDADNSGNVLYLPLEQLGGSAGLPRAAIPPIIAPDASANDSKAPTSRDSRRESRQ
jgi:membrane protease subunit HflK